MKGLSLPDDAARGCEQGFARADEHGQAVFERDIAGRCRRTGLAEAQNFGFGKQQIGEQFDGRSLLVLSDISNRLGHAGGEVGEFAGQRDDNLLARCVRTLVQCRMTVELNRSAVVVAYPLPAAWQVDSSR